MAPSSFFSSETILDSAVLMAEVASASALVSPEPVSPASAPPVAAASSWQTFHLHSSVFPVSGPFLSPSTQTFSVLDQPQNESDVQVEHEVYWAHGSALQ